MACSLAAFGLTLLQGQDYEFAPDDKTEAGLILDEAGLLQDDQQRAALLRSFVERFPTHAGVAWAYNEIRQVEIKRQARQEVIAISEKMLERNGGDLYSGLLLLQQADDAGAKATLEKWRERISRAARQADGKNELASQLVRYCDYLRLNAILEESNAKLRAAELERFLVENPESAYRAQAEVRRLHAYWETLDYTKGLAAARAVLARDADDEDALIFAAFALLDKPEAEKTVAVHARKLLEMLPGKKAPDQNNLVGWEKKKTVYIASANWMIGMLSSRANNHALASVSFQAAVPGFSHDAKATAALLYFSAISAMQIGDKAKAQEQFEKCARIESAYQGKAQQNLQALRSARAASAAADVEAECRLAEQQIVKSAQAMCNCPRSARRL